MIKEKKKKSNLKCIYLYGTQYDRCFRIDVRIKQKLDERRTHQTMTCFSTKIDNILKTELLFYVEIIFHMHLVLVDRG